MAENNERYIPVSENFVPEKFNPLKKLDTLHGKEREKYLEFLEKSGFIAPGNDGLLTELGQGAAQGAVSGLASIGNTLDKAGLGSGVKEYAEDVLRRNRQWGAHEDYSAFSLNPGNIGRTIGQGLGSTAASLAAGVGTTLLTGNPVAGLAAGGAVTFAQTYGDTLDEYTKAMPDQTPQTVKGLAFFSAAGQSLIETVLGPEKVFAGLAKGIATNALKKTTQSFAKRLGKEAAKQAVEEGSEEVAQDFWNRCVEAAGTNNLKLPSWEDVREQFFGGAIPGAVFGGVGGAMSYKRDVAPEITPAPETQAPVADGSGPVPLPEDFPQPAEALREIKNTNEAVRLVDEVAKELGLNVRYFDEEGAPAATDSAGNAVNGWYDKGKNEFWINRQDPGMNPLETLGHEFKHFLDNKHQDLAKTFDELLSAGINEAGKAEQAQTESDYAQAGISGRGNIEFSADTMGKMWTDPQFWQDVAAKAESMNAGMGEKMLQALQEFIKVVQRKLKEIGTPEAKELFDNMKELRAEAVRIAAEVKVRRNGADLQMKSDVDIATNAKGDIELPESVDVESLAVDPERFQFKENKNKEGVVTPLNGEFDQQVARPVFVWEDKEGKRFVVEGHHRLDLAKRSGTKQILAYVHKEADGKDAEWARRRGVMMNIQDNKGTVKDFAEFFRNDDITYDEAKNRGLFRKDENGEPGFIIGKYSGDTLYSAFRNDDITPEKAAVIAEAARGDEGLETAGLKKASGMSKEHLAEYMKLLKKLPREKDEQGDLFGFDDSAIQEADKVSALALKHQRKLRDTINAGKGAIKRPEAAKGVGVSGGKNSAQLLADAQKELARYEHYDTDPELYQQLLEEAGLVKKEEPAPVVSAENAQTTKETTKEEVVSKKENTAEEVAPKVEEVVKENLTTETATAEKKTESSLTPEQKIEKMTPGSRERIFAFTELSDGEHIIHGKSFVKKNNGFILDGNTMNGREIEKAIRASKKKEESAPDNVSLSQKLRDVINSDEKPFDKKVALVKLGQANGLLPKDVEEACEAEVVYMAREINNENISDDEKYQKLVELYNKQPSFTKRTSTSVQNQAYSTPVPLAWALGKRIGLQGKSVYEPTAGTGMLTIAGNPASITVNEIDIVRKGILEKQGFEKVTGNDAAIGKPNRKFDRVIMNPPFASGKTTEFNGYKLSKLDHVIAARALEAMKDDGKAAIIVGANTENMGGSGKANYADHVFRSYLYSNYNVKDDFIVDGMLWKKQGASYPVRVITLSGKKAVADDIEAPQGLEIVGDWSTLYNKLQGEISNAVSETERSADVHADVDTVAEQSANAQNSERNPQGESGSLGKNSGDTQRGQGRSTGRASSGHERKPGRNRGVEQSESERGRLPESSESVSDNGPRMGNSSADIHGQPERNGDKSGSVAEVGRSGSAGTESSVRVEQRPDGAPVSSERVQVGKKRGELNNSYVPASKSTDKMDVVVPRFMAEALEDSLANVEKEVGPIDKFVQSELGYDTPEELYNALSDVQIDGVAQAINSVKHNTGFILGDQTGIGKGRQCAAMLRWAQKHGVVPVLFTRDPKLFTDMYNDGKDIGTTFNPLLVASDAGKSKISEEGTDKTLVKIPKNFTVAFDDFLKEKSEYDCVFCTYSQLSKEGKQREFFSKLTSQRKCLFVMDEAHEAAGDSSRGRFFYGEGGILRRSFVNVVYASATFAKRPDNMALYFRTNIKDAVDNIDDLKEVLSKGGVPLQQLLSANLARDGQYTRRERDFTGVSFDTVIANLNEDEKEELIDRFDRVAHVLGRMIRYSEKIKDTVNKEMKDKYGRANTREKQSVQMASFSSVTHNYIAQLLLASKCDIVIQEAKKAIKAGQKPVIALTNTLESVLTEFVDDNGIAVGEPLSMRFSDILESAVLRMYKFTQKTGKGDAVTQVFNPEEFGLEYDHEKMMREIHDLDDIKLPVSPIDYIKSELEKKGIKTGEITGRKLAVNYNTAVPTLATRTAKETNKNTNVNNFNSGKTDAIILNASGSTGLSLHASAKFADQRQRNMIMAQPSLDIAVVQQMFGRVLRSGQVNNPVYKILSSPLAAERRPMMVLSRKLQSLNANTTANNKGAVSLGLDFMNKYGDLIAQQFLDDNPDIAVEIDLDTDSSKTSDTAAPDGLITKLTGRMAVLSDSQQQDILDDLVARYSNLIEFLKKTGNYDLEITVHDDWDAITKEESEIFEGDPNGSMFKQPVILKKIDIKEMKNIRSAEDVRKDIEENLGNNVNEKLQQDFAKAEEGIDNLEKSYLPGEKPAEFINDRKILLRRTLNDFKNFVRNNTGRMLEITIGEDEYIGTLTGFHVVGKYSDRSPVIASKLMLDFAVTDTIGKISIPYSRFQGQGVTYTRSFLSLKEAFTGEKKAERNERYAVVGNLLRGLEYTESGKVVSYKTHEGKVESALLLPNSWVPSKLVRDPRNEIKDVDEAVKQLNEDGIIRSGDGLNIISRYGRTFIEVPRAKNKGGKYFLDKDLLAIVGGDFTSWGRSMRSPDLDEKQLRKAIERLLSMEDVYLKKDVKEYSLRRHNQVNPIRGEGAVKEEYQEKLDNDTFATRSNAEVNQRAARLIALCGGIKATAELIIEREITGTSDVGQRVIQLVLNSPEFQNMSMDEREKISDIYMNNAGTEIARALAARRLGALKIDDIKSVQAHINAFLSKLDKLKPKNSIRQDILDEFGVDITKLPDDMINTPEKIDALVRRLAAERATKFDKVYEFWINSILSGPGTHAANIIGNIANASYELGVKRFVEALLNTVFKRKDGATFGEFKEMRKAINWQEAKRRAMLAFDFEAIGVESGRLESVRTAIGGELGRKVRLPGRLLRMADEFAKAIIQPIESAAYAYREGKKLKLDGSKLQEYMQKQIQDQESAANEYGYARSIELTFQKEPGAAVKQLISWKESGGIVGTVLKFLLPFIRTPSNILERGLRVSPLGALSLAVETGKLALGKRKFDSDYVGRVAEQLIAWGMIMAFMSADDDEDRPLITGKSATYGSAEQKFKANKIPPYSILIGDTYFSYKRIEPLSTGLALIADGINAFKSARDGEDGTRILKGLLRGTFQLVSEKSYLDSLGEINRVMSDPERSAMKFATNFAASWMPNVVRQTMNAFEDNVRDTKSRNKGAEWWEDQFYFVTDKMGITKASPRIDYFGREVQKDSLTDSGPLKLARLFAIQTVTPDDNMNQAEQLLWNWNKSNPANAYWPDVPAYYFQKNNRKYYFTGDNYRQFAQESGRLALQQINNAFRHGLLNANNPSEQDIKLIKSIFTKARKIVREKMFWQGKFSD